MQVTTPANDSSDVAREKLVPGSNAENDLEFAVVSDPDVVRGWAFEVEGTGHPAAGDLRQGSIKRVASAVGEGATAASLVH
jgi:thioredoxin reductase